MVEKGRRESGREWWYVGRRVVGKGGREGWYGRVVEKGNTYVGKRVVGKGDMYERVVGKHHYELTMHKDHPNNFRI